jgi:hypothetical protein
MSAANVKIATRSAAATSKTERERESTREAQQAMKKNVTKQA